MLSFVGAKKRLRLLKMDLEKSKKAKYEPNVVGLDQSSSDEESSDSDSEKEEFDEIVEIRENVVNTGDTVVENGKDVIDIEKETDRNVEDEINLTKSDKVSINNPANVLNDKDPVISKDNLNKSLKKKTKLVEKTETEFKRDAKEPLPAPTTHIEVKRDPKIQVARLKLPILGEEQRVMELINENEFLIVAGETGEFLIACYCYVVL